jgi:hypothetical protein
MWKNSGATEVFDLGSVYSVRCAPFIGVSVSLSESATGRFTLLEGEPRWTRPEPLRLTYSNMNECITLLLFSPVFDNWMWRLSV